MSNVFIVGVEVVSAEFDNAREHRLRGRARAPADASS